MEKYQNKYRIQFARLQGYDYTQEGLYFITICTHNREHYFGEIIDKKMQLSNIGVLADVFWYEIKNHTKNVELHQFVVMPNHVHGVLEIVGKRDDVSDDTNVDTDVDTSVETMHVVETMHASSLQQISPKPGSVSRIIGAYKSAVTKHAHRLGYDFEWQSRFYDHIIRNNSDFKRIENYIINNPQNWTEDKFYKE